MVGEGRLCIFNLGSCLIYDLGCCWHLLKRRIFVKGNSFFIFTPIQYDRKCRTSTLTLWRVACFCNIIKAVNMFRLPSLVHSECCRTLVTWNSTWRSLQPSRLSHLFCSFALWSVCQNCVLRSFLWSFACLGDWMYGWLCVQYFSVTDWTWLYK